MQALLRISNQERETGMKSKGFILLLFVAVLLPIASLANAQPRVEVFSPQGIVKEVRQVSCPILGTDGALWRPERSHRTL